MAPQRSNSETSSRSLVAAHSSSNTERSSSPPTKKRRNTGEVHARLLSGDTKPELEFDDLNRVVGEYKTAYATIQGVIVRNMQVTSIAFSSWLLVTNEIKQKMLKNLLEKFDVVGEDKLRQNRIRMIMRDFGKKFNNYKSELKAEFYSIYLDGDERRYIVPTGVRESDWVWLTRTYWANGDVKKLCADNKERRDGQEMNHRTGSKGFPAIAFEEKKTTGNRMSRMDMFLKAYKKGEIYPNIAAQEKADHINLLQVERVAGQNKLDDDQILTEVFGPENSGRLCFGGRGATCTSVNASGPMRQTVDDLKRELEERTRLDEEYRRNTEQTIAELRELIMSRTTPNNVETSES